MLYIASYPRGGGERPLEGPGNEAMLYADLPERFPLNCVDTHSPKYLPVRGHGENH